MSIIRYSSSGRSWQRVATQPSDGTASALEKLWLCAAGVLIDIVSGAPIRRENHRLLGELGAGSSALVGNRVTLFTKASANTAINDFGKSYSVKGAAGIGIAF